MLQYILTNKNIFVSYISRFPLLLMTEFNASISGRFTMVSIHAAETCPWCFQSLAVCARAQLSLSQASRGFSACLHRRLRRLLSALKCLKPSSYAGHIVTSFLSIDTQGFKNLLCVIKMSLNFPF